MAPGALSDRLGIRPEETRPVALSFAGGFLVLAFLVLARSLREALYLTAFPVETLPYITAAAALLSVPGVGLFVRVLSRRDPRRVLRLLLLVLSGGLLLLWPLMALDPAVVVFYLWTALGTLLLTSGFWLVTAELFPVRGAKRLFGLIGAGGTLGAMVAGNAVAWLAPRVPVVWLVPGLVLLLVLFGLVLALLGGPRAGSRSRSARGGGSGPEASSRAAAPTPVGSIRDGVRTVWSTPHLRTIAGLVFAATVASTLVDYQFKELARASLDSREALAGFFGAFYGWTGAAALALQLLAAGPLLGRAGVAVTLGVLPCVLLLGSAGLLLAPALAVATAVRGADTSLRKSLHRSGLEVSYVPVPAALRRRTKTFIDSVADSAAEGVGALLVFLWVTLPGFPSRWLSVAVAALAGLLLLLSRRMGRAYVATVTDRLKEGVDADAADLLSGSFTAIDIRPLLREEPAPGGVTAGAADPGDPSPGRRSVVSPPSLADGSAAAGSSRDHGGGRGRPRAVPGGAGTPALRDPVTLLSSPRLGDVTEGLEALEERGRWGPEHVPILVRLLARDPVQRRIASLLVRMDGVAVPHLVAVLRDEDADFVIRRRIPRVLAVTGGAEADEALLEALGSLRFEVRYRAAVALVRRRRAGLPVARGDVGPRVWEAVRREVSRGRPVWELQRLLDDTESDADGIVTGRLGPRGELSLEHTFRLLSLVLEPEAVRAAFRGVVGGDEALRSLALEYLEQALPPEVRGRLWPFIGDLSEAQRRRSARSLDDVVADLVRTDATLFAGEAERLALRRLLDEEETP